jgi:Cytochrome c7 and related cytochrome c
MQCDGWYGQTALAGIAVAVVLSSAAAADQNCLICHGKRDFAKTEPTGRKISLFVDTTLLEKSVHGARGCVDCHDDVIQIPHQPAAKVNCRRCHYSGNPVGAPQGELYDDYAQSVHGKALAEGNLKAPICQDCHGTHDVLSPDSTGSLVHRSHRATTCGNCHMEIYATYRESVHGHALTNGNVDAPDCAGCHGEHNIKGHLDSESQVSPEHISQTCGECHGPMGVASKYGIKTDRTTTFEESFHGIAHKMDNRTVANCSSCHGFHDIRPHTDPRSTIHTGNIVKTCGKPECHPEATPQFASGKIHVDPTKEEAGLVYYITKFFTVLTIATLAGLFIFIILDLARRAKSARAKG